MAETLRPDTPQQVLEAVQWALSAGAPLDIQGAGSKRGLGRPTHAAHVLDTSGLNGVSLYEPEELVLTAGAGTAMTEIEGLLSQNRQQLAFEPADLGEFYGGAPGRQTVGGVLAANLSGPRRLKAGAARDHFLGFKAVTGRGEEVKSGGRVVKNVTGYDLCKLLAGSHGTLAVMTEVTLKVLPAPEKSWTVLLFGLDETAAVSALAAAGCSPHEVASLAHLPRAVAARSSVAYVRDAGVSVTAIRVEGPGPSVEHRTAALKAQFTDAAELEELHSHNTAAFWREIRDVAALLPDAERALWKLSVTPTEAPTVLRTIRDGSDAEAYFDWAGGLLWLAVPARDDAAADLVRAAVGERGHATLMRAPDIVRAAVPVFQPQSESLAALGRRLREAFDPERILNRGRLVAED